VAAVSETPGRRDFSTRVKANRAVAEAFVRYFLRGPGPDRGYLSSETSS
jgi:hypothetical protein